MDLQLQGKHVLITGASKGIGFACAQGFIAEGAKVSLVARTAEALDQAVAALKADGKAARFAADLRDADSAEQALDAAEAAFGPVDVLVNSAGAAKRVPPAELTPARWRDAMDAKFFTYINMMDPVIKRMGTRGSGVIINIVGTGGKIARATHIAGGAANAALMLASAGAAVAYADKGVRVNAVNPGPVLTDRLKEGFKAEVRLAESQGRPAPGQPGTDLPLGRPSNPEEIADMVVFLASPRSSYTTGAIIALDGAATATVV
jgi:NAD(P)-dependent dehydrogenase (short-subunit alcohol dehydrogenase family)